jgi:hypothetical protein
MVERTRRLLYGSLAVLLCLGAGLRAADENVPARVEESFRRTRAICRRVEKIRGLKFKKDVPVAVQARSDFRAHIEAEMAEQFGEDGGESFIAALVKLGVLDKAFDLSDMVVKMLESQAAAHYVPESDTYYLLKTDMPAMLLDITSAHELCHALQDQHFDLARYLKDDIEAIRDNGDMTSARQCVVEGEATLVMTIWMLMQQMQTDKVEAAEPMASMAISVQAMMEIDQIIEMTIQQMSMIAPGMSSMIDSLKEIRNMPRFLVESLYASYLKGALMVDYVRGRGGWDAVGRLYRDPPRSTEQVLHPEKLVGKRDDPPVDVRLEGLEERLARGWEARETDVLGELGTLIFFKIWQDPAAPDPAAAASAAAGWGGDRYTYCVNEEQDRDFLAWKTVWDSEQDAGEFAVAYRMTLPLRFPKRKQSTRSEPDSPEPYQVWEVEPGRFLKLAAKGRTVTIVDTTDEAMLHVLTVGAGVPEKQPNAFMFIIALLCVVLGGLVLKRFVVSAFTRR